MDNQTPAPKCPFDLYNGVRITFADGPHDGMEVPPDTMMIRSGTVDGDPITAGGITVVGTETDDDKPLYVNVENILTATPPEL